MKNLHKIIISIGAFLMMPLKALAQAGGAVQQGAQKINTTGVFGSGGLLSGNWTVWDLIVKIIQIALTFAGLIAVCFIIWGGYLYMTAGGNSEQAGKGRTSVLNAVIGLIIIIMAYVIVNVTVNTFSNGFSIFGIF